MNRFFEHAIVVLTTPISFYRFFASSLASSVLVFAIRKKRSVLSFDRSRSCGVQIARLNTRHSRTLKSS